VADATVKNNNPTRNYGSRSDLEVDANSIKIIYFRFNVSGLSGTVVSARIQLECTNQSPFGGTIYDISDTSWQERTVTWENRPAVDGLAQDALGAVSVGDIVELDVTAVVTGNGTYNFAMDSNNNNGADYYSREGLNPPVLILTTTTN
jgi:spore coat protein U-like protein